MASEQQQAMNPGVAPPEAPEPARQQQQQQQRHPGRGGGRGQGRGRGQGIRGGRANHQQQGRGPPGGRSGPVGIAPTSGIPYGHVPAYLPGSSSLVEELDKRILMVLRDGRHLIGVSAG